MTGAAGQKRQNSGLMLSPEQCQFLDAAEQGDLQTVRDLLAAGVDVNTADSRRLPRNRTALMHAAAGGHLEVVEALLAAGAKVDAKDTGFNVTLPGGNTALLLAVNQRQPRVAQRLLEAGANPNVATAGVSVFSQAAALGDVALLRQLLRMGLDPNEAVGKRTDLPLVSALFAGHTDAVRALLSAGANPNLPSTRGIAPLEIAVEAGLTEAVQLLLHRGADPNSVSSRGFTPLMLAVAGGRTELVKILLRRAAAVNHRTRRGQTALDLAQQRLDQHAGIGVSTWAPAQNPDGVELLKAQHEIIALLLKAGACAGKDLRPEPPPARSKRVSARRHAGCPARPKTPDRLGVKDFLEFLHYTEPEFAVIAVCAPINKVSSAFASFRHASRWLCDVPCRPSARPQRVPASFIGVAGMKNNRWTVIVRSIFSLGKNDCILAAEDAKELSGRLDTKAIAFTRERKAGVLGYDYFESGRLSEHAQWIEESSSCVFKSRFHRQPGKEEPDADFIDRVFRQQGIYLPVCYPGRSGRTLCLRVDLASADAVQRADILLMATRKKHPARTRSRPRAADKAPRLSK